MPRIANLDEKVREGLRTQIMSGALGGGAHLSELKISKEFNVSRTPVREALCALAADGLIEMVPHRGAFVKEIKQATPEHSYQAYSYVMGAYTALAAEVSTIETTMQLEQATNAAINASPAMLAEKLQDMFFAISQTAGNPVLDEAMTTISRRFDTTNVFANAATQAEAVKQQLTFLQGAFKRNKTDVAEKTMRQLVGLLTN